MSIKDREIVLLEYLCKKKSATVRELCDALFVSEPTMRRDLSALNTAGKIIRTHGGAIYRNEPGENLPLAYREKEHSDAKTAIGKKCLSLISDGETIMVDGSSTGLALLRNVGTKQSIVVITNSAKAPLVLSDTGVKTFVTGGELATDTYAYTGSYTENFLQSFNADVCFFSVRTLTLGGELTDNAIAENAVRKIMMAKSRKKVLMLDSQKIGKACMNTLCTLSDVDYVVCEKELSTLFPEYALKFI